MPGVDLDALARRLDRIENSIGRLGLLDDLINPVDPPPDDWGRLRPGLGGIRLVDLLRELVRRRPGDPPPDDLGRRGGVFETRLGEILQRNPGWFSDPPPDDFLNVRVLDLIRRWRGGFSDPAPDDLAGVRVRDLIQRIPGGGVADPPPDDIARLTKSEIESLLQKLGSEQLRLKSFEKLLNDRLGSLGKK